MVETGPRKVLHAPMHSVVGMRGDQSSFISHVGLLAVDAPVRVGEPVRVAHMGPPIEPDGIMRLDVIAWIALTADEIRKIELWVAEALEEKRPSFNPCRPDRVYIARPHVEWVVDEVTGVPRYRRFSCVGFVVEAYREAVQIGLVTQQESDLPPIPLPALEIVYPGCERPKIRERLGLVGDPPYYVMLPGYVINSLDRPDHEVRDRPFEPQLGDEEFPPLRRPDRAD